MKTLGVTLLFFPLTAASLQGQTVTEKVPTLPPAVRVFTEPAPEPQELRIEMEADRSVRILGLNGYETWSRDPGMLRKALAANSAKNSSAFGPADPGPKITVRAASSLDMKTIFEVLSTARGSASELALSLPEFYLLRIPAEPRPPSEMPFYPNPLTLLSNFDSAGRIMLNNQAFGTNQNYSQLQAKLKAVFRERERTGVFREGSNEIEKKMFVRVPETATFAQLASFVKALAEAGGSDLWLAIENLDIEQSVDLTGLLPLPDFQKPAARSKPKPKRKPSK